MPRHGGRIVIWHQPALTADVGSMKALGQPSASYAVLNASFAADTISESISML
ncbi:hypothetical protein [Labrys neptuniae]